MRNKTLVRHMVKSGIVRNQRELGEKMGYKNESAFSQVINGRVVEPKEFTAKLKNLLPTLNEGWLVTGEGQMLTTAEPIQVNPIGIGAVSKATATPVRVVVPTKNKIVLPKKNAFNILRLAGKEQKNLVTTNSDGTVTIERVEETTTPIPIAPIQANIDTGKTSPNEIKEPITAENAEVIELIREEIRAEVIEDIREEVKEEIRVEVIEEIKQEESILVVPSSVANRKDEDIKAYIEDEDKATELKRLTPSELTEDAEFCLEVRKTSMAPALIPNDRVFVKLLDDKTFITDGGTYFFNLRTHPAMVRRAKKEDGKLRLIAFNPRFGDVVVTYDEIINTGDIVGMFRKTITDQFFEMEAIRQKKDAQVDSLINGLNEDRAIIREDRAIQNRLISIIEKRLE